MKVINDIYTGKNLNKLIVDDNGYTKKGEKRTQITIEGIKENGTIGNSINIILGEKEIFSLLKAIANKL